MPPDHRAAPFHGAGAAFPPVLLMLVGILGLFLAVPGSTAAQRAGPRAPNECTLAWRCALSGRVHAFAADNGMLYAAVDDRRVYAIDHRGRVHWRTGLGEVPGRELNTAPEGMLTLTTRGGSIFLLNERGGIIWERDVGEGYAGSTAAPNGTLFLASGQQLQAVSHTGRLRWQRRLPAAPSGPPVYSARYGLLVPCSDGFLRSYSPGGILQWEFLAAGIPGRPIARSEGIYLPNEAGTLALVSADGHLIRQFRNIGAVRFAAPAAKLGTPGEGVLAATREEVLHVSLSGGRKRIALLPFAPLAGSAAEDRLAFFGRQGAVAVVSPASGESAALQIPPATALPVFFGEGLLAVGGSDWIVYAYRCGSEQGDSPAEAGAESGSEGRGATSRQDGRPESGAADSGAESVSAAGLMREAMLGSGDRSLLKELLDQAENILESTSPRKSELDYLRAAEAVLTEGVLNPKRRDGRIINDFPELRRRAAELVGRHGDLRSRQPLFELLRYEWSAGGVRETVDALGRLGGVGGGEGVSFLLQRFRAAGSSVGDALAAAAIDYVGREFRFHGILRPDAVELLQTIYLGGFSRKIRLQAVETLRGLKRDA